MHPPALQHLKVWFKHHTATYLCGNPHYDRDIQLKQAHTGRVAGHILHLGRSIHLPDTDLNLAAASAWLHDLGRFEQYRRFQTFNDRQSVNHAHLSVREAVRHRVLQGCARSEQRLILGAVAFHNAAAVPARFNPRARLFMRLLRDADKLDIWKVVLDYYQRREQEPNPTIELGLPNTPDISPGVLEAILQHTFVKAKDIKTLNDFKMMQISWVFDLNFQAAFQVAAEQCIIDRLAATLPATAVVARGVQETKRFVQQKLAK